MKRIMILFIAAILIFSGCARNSDLTQPTESTPATERYLKLEVTQCENGKNFSGNELGGNFAQGMGYRQVTNVTVEIDGTDIPLEEALKSNNITDEEIFFYARRDAALGICTETPLTLHGLTHFLFNYPEFDLDITYDVYETPDGQQHLISDLFIHAPGTQQGHHMNYYDENFERLDKEDWGLTFEILEINETGIKLKCTQSGGQQIGELKISSYELYGESYGWVHSGTAYEGDLITIPQNTTTEIYLNWSDSIKELPEGTEEILINVHDVFDQEQVHPLMRDFTDWQHYVIELDAN